MGSGEDDSPGVEEALIALVEDWLNAALPREKRQMVETNHELLSDESSALVKGLLSEYANQPIQRKVLQEHVRLIKRIRDDGGTLRVIRQAYVDVYSGLALDVPAWLDELERELHHVTHTKPEAERVQFLRQMLARAVGDPEVSPEPRAELHARLWDALDDLTSGTSSEQQEEGLTHLEAALEVYTREQFPQQYARMHLYLGNSFQERIAGNRRENLEYAIACYQKALQVYDVTKFPDDYALVCNNLGNTYYLRISGAHQDNLEEAIACYDRALQIYTLAADPDNYAMVQNNLGNTYLARLAGGKRKNLGAAIACYQRALEVYKVDDHPCDYAMLQIALGAAYSSLLDGVPRDNLETALTSYRNALKIYTRAAHPRDYAKAQSGLGTTYRERIAGDRRENLERSIACYERALAVYTREALPLEFAATQMQLGHSYRERIAGVHNNNLKKALACYHRAFEVYTPEDFPRQYRDAQIALAWLALSKLAMGAQAHDNLDTVRQTYSQAHTAYASARQVQAELAWLESTDQGRAHVRGGWEGLSELYVRDAWCLWQLGDFKEALVALEAGRAQALAEAQALAGPVLEALCIEHGAAFREVLQSLQEARRSDNRVMQREGRARLLAIRQSIRTHCQPEFLPSEPDYETIVQAPSPGQALVYLAATDFGGLAVILPPRATDQTVGSQQVDVLPLPELTWNQVDNWLIGGREGGPVVGGLRVALDHAGIQLLERWAAQHVGADSTAEILPLALRDVAARLPQEYGTLRTALTTLIDTWQEAAAQMSRGTPAELRQASELQKRLQCPLQEALQSGILREELGWPFLKAELDVLLPDLSAKIMRPLREVLNRLGLDGAEQPIGLIPGGRLSALPLHAALVSDPHTGQKVPFQETCELSYQASARTLAAVRLKAATLPQMGAVITVGNPKPSALPHLPWAEAEAEAIYYAAETVLRSGSQAMLAEEATLVRLKKTLSAIQEGRTGAWVEIASHGHADPADAKNCYMLLAHGERLTLADLQREQILEGVRGFVASGCVTSLGDLDTAPDELSSFAGGVLQAGAACAVATLWSVSDRATFLLMLHFYQLIIRNPDLTPTRALREATTWLRQATKKELDELARVAVAGVRPLSFNETDFLREALRGICVPESSLSLQEEAAFEALHIPSERTSGKFRLIDSTEQHGEHPYAHPIYWASTILYGA